MSEHHTNLPVIMVAFNRPAKVRQVLEVVRSVRPPVVVLITDGPRPGRQADVDNCREVRRVLESIDWPCEILRNHADANLGCGRRIATGLSWAFEAVPRAVVLEDDILPHPSFFRYCEELLDRYADDERIMMISGANVLGQWKPERHSYHFSYYGGIHGWASWRRAWTHFDPSISRWKDPDVRQRLKDILVDGRQYAYRASLYDQICDGNDLGTWDYQWGFARLVQSGLSIVPSVNLVRNIGFDASATHTRGVWTPACDRPVAAIDFPLRHPDYLMVDREFDNRMFRSLQPNWRCRWKGRLRACLGTGHRSLLKRIKTRAARAT
ncbi:MAG: glycosyltransferase family 2 protein [Thermoguttaceae bacterium]